jgi:hypothetical protein
MGRLSGFSYREVVRRLRTFGFLHTQIYLNLHIKMCIIVSQANHAYQSRH